MKEKWKKMTIGELAEIAGVSIRTLRYYDQEGLLVPSERSTAGYRLYTMVDLIRLQEILIYRELEIPVKEILGLLGTTGQNRRQRLISFNKRLNGRIGQLLALQSKLEKVIRDETEEINMQDLSSHFEGFTKEEVDKFQEEARENFSGDLYDTAAQRTRSWSEEEWKTVKAEAASIYTRLAEKIDQPLEEEAVQSLVQEYFQHMQRFYPCSSQVFKGLADLYDQDPRYQRTFKKYHPDLGPKLSQAMRWAVEQGVINPLD
jgi:DNA-binding transcriptional MerR regulator